MKLLFSSLKTWIANNKLQFFLLLAVLLLGSSLRLYKISQYMTFLGDEGRDALVVKRLLEGDLVFVGPGTSVGNMYLGPFYYYFMAPFLLMFNYSPVGPAIGVALLGILTILLVWVVGKEFFNSYMVSFFASSLYAVSPVVIIYSRHSWNPNIMPFFSLLLVYSLWRSWYRKDYRFIPIVGVSFAICLQSHYLALSLLPFIFLFFVVSSIESVKNRKYKMFFRYTLFSLLFFSLLMLPLFLFDAKHGWRNFYAFSDFLFSDQGGVSFNLFLVVSKFYSVWSLLITRLITAKNVFWGDRLSLVLLLLVIWKIIRFLKKHRSEGLMPFLFTLAWVLTGVVSLSLYKESIYDHYFGFVFPALFLLLSSVLYEISKAGRFVGKIISFALFAFLVSLNIYLSPLKDPPSYQLERSIRVAEKIANESGGRKFNLAVIAERNYEGAYLYFLDLWKTQVSLIDPQKAEETIADQLFVVCEYGDKKKCQPTSNPKAEVANFGWSKIEKMWELEGIVLFKLVHNESGEPQPENY